MVESSPFDDYLRQAQDFIDPGQSDSEETDYDLRGETDYKLEMIENLRRAREAVLSSDSEWPSLVKQAVTRRYSPFDWRVGEVFWDWFESRPDDALSALQALWADDDTPPGQRIRVFISRIPEHQLYMDKGVGTRLTPVSVLLMALGTDYPPFKTRSFNRAYKRTGYPRPSAGVDEGAVYEHALAFLDQLLERSTGSLSNRLEAQGVVWWARDQQGSSPPPDVKGEDDGEEPEEDESLPADVSPWDEFVRHARELIASGQMDSKELENKFAIGRKLSEAREAVVSNMEDWAVLVKSGITVRLIFSMRQTELRDWIDTSPDEALMTLQAIWTQDNSSIAQRVRTFSGLLPRSVVSGAGVRTNVASVLLMGLDAQRYPPFMRESFNAAYSRTRYGQPERDADEAALYGHALGFLDRFIEEASARGLILHHRLEAQSVVHSLHRLRWRTLFSDQGPKAVEQEPNEVVDLETLADELMLDLDFLRRIETLLEDKRQVIFQGPPGTGKTFVARKLAARLAGSLERVRLVQFHPSYAYEDFVQGFRPTLRNGQAGFELTDGPLLDMARRARGNPDAKHFLVIDEINRGNLAKVFGELYFLLEYRDEPMQLQYSDQSFSLPDNLYIIGTMNTADRSIALVDLALRRRFHFVEFHPDKEPVQGLLRRWLDENAPGMAWVAGIVDRANEELGEDNSEAAIGPSYFMKAGLDNEHVRLIWEHNVRPYVQEQLYGEPDRLAEFDLDRLRREVGSGDEADDAGGEQDG